MECDEDTLSIIMYFHRIFVVLTQCQPSRLRVPKTSEKNNLRSCGLFGSVAGLVNADGTKGLFLSSQFLQHFTAMSEVSYLPSLGKTSLISKYSNQIGKERRLKSYISSFAVI